MNLTTERANEPSSAGLVFSVNSLLAHLEQVTGPRAARGVRYPLVLLLALLILAKLGGEDSMKGMAEWVRLREPALLRLLQVKRQRLPHQTTYERVLADLDLDELEQVIGHFFARQRGDAITVTLDGKVLRGTIAPGAMQGVHLLAAYVPEQGVVLMQVEVASKANEITAAAHLLDAVDLRNCVVTGNAMFTQQTLCDHIVLAGGDYVFPVKDNHPTLRRAVSDRPIGGGRISCTTAHSVRGVWCRCRTVCRMTTTARCVLPGTSGVQQVTIAACARNGAMRTAAS